MRKCNKILVVVVGLFIMSIVGCGLHKTLHMSKIQTNEDYNVLILKKDEMNFGVSTEKPSDADFYINSNFFTKSNNSIGLVVINRLRHSKRQRGGGYFYVVNGVPHVASGFCPLMTDYASQSILWAIDNGIKNEGLLNTRHANESAYRTIMGENREGDIMIISSNRVGLVTIRDIVEFAENQGMIEGILLDGGSSVDYKFSDDSDEIVFQSVPDIVKSAMDINQPTTYIYGNFKNN